MAVRFYNPGFKIYELMRFDHPTNDSNVQNLISYLRVDAEQNSFFDVPTEATVMTESGEQQVSVRFADRIQNEYRELAVIRINPNAKNIGEEDNVAVNEKDAKEKGQRLWKECLMNLVREHERIVAQTRANGLRPAPAIGNVKAAYKIFGLKDPAQDVADVVESKQDSSEIAELKQQIAELTKLVKKG